MKKIIFIAFFVSAITSMAVAHSGGTDSAGCHVDHRTGIYHCH